MYTKDNSNITFSYEIDAIFEDASRISAYNAKSIRDKEGNSMFTDFALSDDEKDIFIQGLNSIVPEIREKIIKLASPSTNTDTSSISFVIKDNGVYNSAVLDLVDSSFHECLVEGALKAWYKNCSHMDFMKLYLESFAISLEKLYQRMFQLKIKMQSTDID